MPLSALWAHLFFGSALLAAALIDVEHFLIPDAITFTGMMVAVLLACLFPETHLGPGLTGLPGGDQVITGAVLTTTGRCGYWLASHPRLAAAADVALGAAVGYLILRLLMEAGQRLWGWVRVTAREPVAARISPQGIVLGDDELDGTWEDLLTRPGDAFRAQALDVSFANRVALTSPTPLALRVTRTVVAIGNEQWPLAEIGTIQARLLSWEYPRDVMGHGDLKLLAMIGAFLGPDATVFTLMGGAFLGCAGGLIRAIALPAQRGQPLPFGLFLASGALLWTLFGEAFVRWYGHFLTGTAG